MSESLDAVLEQVDQQLTGSSSPSAAGAEVAAKAPSFANLTPNRTSTQRSFDHLYGVRLDVEAVLGRTDLSVEEMLSLDVGSVVELDRLVSDPVDLMVQNVRVARGEVVVVNDQFAIRITEITSSRH
jgi:flagellar motor switch protein FliN/FliY